MAPKAKTAQVTPVKDLLAEVLDEVQPLGILPIGGTKIEIWPVDYISVQHRLIYFDAQTDAMLRYQELQDTQGKLQELYATSSKTEDDEKQIKTLASRVQQIQQEIAPLVCTYIEALAEMERGSLLQLLETELAARTGAKKNLPISLFINKLSQQVTAWTEARDKAAEAEEETGEDPKTVEAEAESVPEESELTNTSEE